MKYRGSFKSENGTETAFQVETSSLCRKTWSAACNSLPRVYADFIRKQEKL